MPLFQDPIVGKMKSIICLRLDHVAGNLFDAEYWSLAFVTNIHDIVWINWLWRDGVGLKRRTRCDTAPFAVGRQ